MSLAKVRYRLGRIGKPQLRLHDYLFPGNGSSGSPSPYVSPAHFTWQRSRPDPCVEFFTNGSLQTASQSTSRMKIGWLLESPLVRPESMDYAVQHTGRFHAILTHNKGLLETDDRFVFCPVGGSWVANSHWKIYPKSKSLSIIASRKAAFEGHKLRHWAIDLLSNTVDAYGTGYRPVQRKETALKDYRYTIVIENCRRDYYFTEKLIDAFACGTVPIYWGCPSIGKFFDHGGIIPFDGFESLFDVVSKLSVADYQSRRPSIRRNFELAKEYKLAEDWLWKHQPDYFAHVK